MAHPGLFVTFEGGEGAGKSMHLNLLAQRLQAEGEKVRCVREPGGTPLGEEIRPLLKHHDYAVCPLAELFLLQASRAQLVQDVIRPALKRGEIVLCDRFYDSTIAYQVYGRGLSLDQVRSVVTLAIEETKPDVTFFLDVPPALGLENKRRQRAHAPPLPGLLDRIEGESMAFHARVYQGFQALATAEPTRVTSVPYLTGELMPKMQEQMYQTVRLALART